MKVKEKKVELIELFYDLIYVYAISRMTMLIEEPTGGTIPLSGLQDQFLHKKNLSNLPEIQIDLFEKL